ncbi:cell division protein FtsA [Rubrivirga sp. SAORIC476]|uniref:cell division protein FtsA n=1 Tax=Rubrivirga sp. SAORIC476 TaxID=1961794 RepID=UPI000BA93419|nr:cell division protein FtsA [Rubrivirga sp. SAORIC476]MAQ95271.1 cell division protein FtsA [Rhodothermaceae bacterium]MBC14238.1 cell division protein FtsA [Rhodothermaceae bacterium]PAP81356.1 cell division protein FtsA [Rubrivirga sp. SAORIC476]
MPHPDRTPSTGDRVVVGVDIGTTKICAVVASADDLDRIHVRGVGVAESEGLNRGVVVNIDKTVEAVKKAIAEAEHASGVEVQSVVVGIAGDHIQSFQSRGVITVSGGEIDRNDVLRLLEDTKHVAMPADREILHVLPQEFIVDGQDGVADPIGMSGVRLEANVHIITGLVSAAKNVYRCIEKAGFAVDDIVLEPLASSHAVLHDDEKEVGVVLVDIGGGTTDIAIFEDKTIRHTAVVAVAGNKVTDDLRKGLGILHDQAERLKHEFGVALVDMVAEDREIQIPGIGGRPDKSIGQSTLAQIIQPRLEEILEFVAIEIKRSGYGRHLSAGVVLTGGGALIPGTAELAAEILGLEARVGRPLGLAGGLVEEVDDPKYATGVGLVLHGLRTGAGRGASLLAADPEPATPLAMAADAPGLPAEAHGDGYDSDPDGLVNKIASRMRSWFDEL